MSEVMFVSDNFYSQCYYYSLEFSTLPIEQVLIVVELGLG